jgi:rhamnosyltransferase subunit B
MNPVQPLHVILTSIGTDGDVFPYVALGATLVRRGHRATLVAAEPYRGLAASEGLAFRSLLSHEENGEGFGNPDFWHPLKGPIVAARWGVTFLPRQYELFAELAGDGAHGRPVLVASPGLVAARVVQDKLGTPLASVALQPWMIQSCSAPPVMPGGLTLPRRAPRWAGAAYWRGIDLVGAWLMGKPLNALRARVGLAPVRRVFRWWLSPQLVLGMFPDWYGLPQPDWPPQVRVTGFPMYDGQTSTSHDAAAGLSPELESFLDAGLPPVAFTFGTGMRHAAGLFRVAADTCQGLGARGLLLTKHADQLPADLPPTVRHVPYAPFQRLFPRCAAVVHHGGVGTVAKALAAGVPQLVVPLAYDQTDNAIRVKRLGAGEWLRAREATPARVAAALAKVITRAVRETCRRIAARFEGQDALGRAAGEVERLRQA